MPTDRNVERIGNKKVLDDEDIRVLAEDSKKRFGLARIL